MFILNATDHLTTLLNSYPPYKARKALKHRQILLLVSDCSVPCLAQCLAQDQR